MQLLYDFDPFCIVNEHLLSEYVLTSVTDTDRHTHRGMDLGSLDRVGGIFLRLIYENCLRKYIIIFIDYKISQFYKFVNMLQFCMLLYIFFYTVINFIKSTFF